MKIRICNFYSTKEKDIFRFNKRWYYVETRKSPKQSKSCTPIKKEVKVQDFIDNGCKREDRNPTYIYFPKETIVGLILK